MTDFNMMHGAGGTNMLFFSWLTYILTVALLVLGIIALWKYINRNQ